MLRKENLFLHISLNLLVYSLRPKHWHEFEEKVGQGGVPGLKFEKRDRSGSPVMAVAEGPLRRVQGDSHLQQRPPLRRPTLGQLTPDVINCAMLILPLFLIFILTCRRPLL